MYYKEIKDLLNKLNSSNIDNLKPTLTRKINELILNINDDDISDCELEELCNFFIMRETLREDARQEKSLSEGILIENFIKAFDEFINEINTSDYISDAIDLINTSIRSIGGIARGFRLVKKYAPKEGVINNVQYFSELKDEFYKQLRCYTFKGIYEEHFVICGLINTIKFELEEKSQEHGQFVITMLTDYETQRLKSFKEFENEPHLNEFKIKMKREFGLELQRRIYSWNNLTKKLTDHYYLEKLYNDECDN